MSIITTDERTMLRDYLLLLQMQVMAQKSLTDIKLSGNLLAKLYYMSGKVIEDRIFHEIKTHRQTLKSRGIIVSREEHDTDGFVIRYHYTCRGYTEHFAMTRDVMRSEISLRFTRYIAEFGENIKRLMRG